MSVTYGQNDNYRNIYDGKTANCCQNVRGNKTKTKMTAKANKLKTTKNNKNNNKMGGGGRELKKHKTEWSSDVVIIIDLH